MYDRDVSFGGGEELLILRTGFAIVIVAAAPLCGACGRLAAPWDRYARADCVRGDACDGACNSDGLPHPPFPMATHHRYVFSGGRDAVLNLFLFWDEVFRESWIHCPKSH